MLVRHRVTGALADEIANRRLEILWRARLRQHGVASCAPSAPRIGRKGRIPSDRENGNIAGARVLLQTTRQFEPVDPGMLRSVTTT